MAVSVQRALRFLKVSVCFIIREFAGLCWIFLYTRFEILYSNFFYISLATPNAKKKKQKEKKNPTKQKGQRCLQVVYEGKWEVSVGEYNVTLVLVGRVGSAE